MSKRTASRVSPPGSPRADLLPDAPSTPRPAPRTPVRWGLAALCGLIAFLLYAPVLDHDFVDWDDTGVLLETEGWRGLGAEQLAWMFTTNHYGHYQPVTWLTYGLDFVLWGRAADGEGAYGSGLEAWGFHFTNHVFHAMNAALVFLLSLALLRRAFVRSAPPPWTLVAAAGFSALFFALHPLRVESVAWVTERRDLVSAFFLLATVLAYVRYTEAEGRPRIGWYAAMLALYAVSMLSKVGGAPLPLILLVLDWFPLRRIGLQAASWWTPAGRRAVGRAALEKLPMLALALGFSVATIGQQRGVWLIPLEQHPIDSRLGQALYGLVFYPWKTVAPAGLLPLYELTFPFDPLQAKVLVSAAILAVMAVLAVRLRATLPGLAAAILVYGLLVGPLLGFFQNGPQIVADRYSYLSTLGFGLLLAAAVAIGLERAGTAAGRRALVGAAAVVPLVLLSFLTVRQASAWRDSETFWASLHEADPEASFGANGHGYQLLEAGRVAEAIPLFEAAIARMPTNREAYFNLWNALEQAGETSRLFALYLEHQRAPIPEVAAEAAWRLGTTYQRRSDWARAAQAYRTLLDVWIWPRMTEAQQALHRRRVALAWSNLAICLRQLGIPTDAASAARTSLLIDDRLPRPRIELAELEIEAGNLAEARRLLDEVQAMAPTHSRLPQALEALRAAEGG